MKRLIIINGTMGAGKTSICNELMDILQPCVFLDGDWCWNMKPFIVTDETKNMVVDNIVFLLNSYLSCSEYKNIIFCWVMQYESVINDILGHLNQEDYNVYKFTLEISKQALTERILKDVELGKRTIDVLERSLERLSMYDNMDTVKIDVSNITPNSAARQIADMLD